MSLHAITALLTISSTPGIQGADPGQKHFSILKDQYMPTGFILRSLTGLWHWDMYS